MTDVNIERCLTRQYFSNDKNRDPIYITLQAIVEYQNKYEEMICITFVALTFKIF